MKKIVLYFCFFLPSFLIAQSNPKLVFFARLDYSGLYALDNDRGTIGESIERGKTDLNFGINYNQKIRKRLWLKIGLGFTSLGGETITFENVIINSSSPNDLTTINKLSYHFLEIPTAIRFEFRKDKLIPFFETGLSTMYYLQNRRKKITGDFKEVENYRDEDIQHIQIALMIGFGLSYPISTKWETFFQTNIRCHLTELEDSNSDQYLWSSGLVLGTRFKF